jgi:putative FmdB family regulatory protein
MPIYEYECKCGKEFDRYLPLSQYLDPQNCECGKVALKVIRTAPMGFVQAPVCYDSPIDGRPITSRAERMQDLARSGCIEYDPEMRKDADRRVKEQEQALDKSVDDYVEREFATMPIRKKEALAAEMQQGITVEPVRQTLGD